ncbi:MAG: transposase [Chloroflexi bacterium]|nr:transposase [Chloroflexota bacterium]
MQLAEQHIIHKGDPRWAAIDQAAWASKNIYNAALYKARQAYCNGEGYPGFKVLEAQFKQHHLLPDQQLPAKVVQQVLMQLDNDWQSYFAALKAWQANSAAVDGKPQPPKYKNKARGRNQLVYTDQAVSKIAFKKRGVIAPSQLPIEIYTQQRSFDQVRILPRRTHYVVEVVYTVDIEPDDHLDPERVAVIDIGVDNLATVAFNQPDFAPLLVNGRPLKSINHTYNKECAGLQSQLEDNRHTSHQLDRLTDKRNRRIEAYLHLASRRIIDVLRIFGFGTLVIGKNDGWKQGVNLGKRTNQNFVQIPHTRFIQMLTYKAQLVGIKVIVTEESYTSKCSFLDLEPVSKQDTYAGKRIKRWLFQASDGREIHADVNGAFNIMRKVIPDAVVARGIAAAVVQPMRVTPA